MRLTQANWFYYFTENPRGTVKCNSEGCNYSKELNKSRSTNCLSTHIQNHHPNLYKQREEFIATQKKKQESLINSNPLKRSFAQAFAANENIDAEATTSENPPIIVALKAKKPWNKDGSSTIQANEMLMKFLATSVKPFSLVENSEFREFCQILQPNYVVPNRHHFAKYQLPSLYNQMKEQINNNLKLIKFVSLTTDAWTSSDNKHSLISLTGHFLVNFHPKIAIIGCKLIKERHTADAITSLIRECIIEYEIQDKIFCITRDTESTMKKGTRDLKSIDCTAHVLQLCIKDGLKVYDDGSLNDLIEKTKKFGRKVRKSRVLTSELEEFQNMEDLAITALIKNIEVHWNSLYMMLELFLKNKTAINLLAIENATLPMFTQDEWKILDSIYRVLKPIYDATMELQKADASISIIIPLFRSIIFALKKEEEERFTRTKNEIIKAMETRFCGIDDQRELVLATMLDARFKSHPYLELSRMDEYKNWLISAAEIIEIQQSQESNSASFVDRNNGSSEEDDIFAQFEKCSELDLLLSSPILSPPVSEARQNAENEVNEYLMDKKLKLKQDPFAYWKLNAEKWPLLAMIAQKYLSAPATSSESERLFSTAGLIVDDLRKKLTPENLEMLLYLHHNLKI